jgi:tRNA pseudouridine55 synthase
MYNGFLVIDKPEGKSSAFIDFLCRKKLNTKKAGHLGTLDPFATGVLVIAINNATRVIPYINVTSKTYEFEICFGAKTITGDKTGVVIERHSKNPTKNDLLAVLPGFVGEIPQKPHQFSAIKINGQRAYDIARKGVYVNIQDRLVRIFALDIIKQIDKERFLLMAEVSPGTYIRSLCEDIAKALCTVAYTNSLRRTKDGRFTINEAVSIHDIDPENIKTKMHQIDEVVDKIEPVTVSTQEAEDLLVGKRISIESRPSNGIYLAQSLHGYIGIIESVNSFVKQIRLVVRPTSASIDALF